MVKIARTGISTSNCHLNFQTKKDIGYPLVPKFSSFRGLSSTLSWKCPHITLSPSFGLFQLEKWQKSVFHVWLSMALWPKTCPCDLLTRRRKKEIYCHITFTACGRNFCKLHFLDLSLKELFTWSFLLCTTQCVGMNWMGWAELNGIDTWECHIWQR